MTYIYLILNGQLKRIIQQCHTVLWKDITQLIETELFKRLNGTNKKTTAETITIRKQTLCVNSLDVNNELA